MSILGILRVNGIAERAVDQSQRGTVHDVQDQVAEDRQETRAQTQSEETGANERQEDHEREHPREEGKRQAASYVGTRNARLEEVRVDEGEAQTDAEMDGDRRVEDIGGVLNYDVVG